MKYSVVCICHNQFNQYQFMSNLSCFKFSIVTRNCSRHSDTSLYIYPVLVLRWIPTHRLLGEMCIYIFRIFMYINKFLSRKVILFYTPLPQFIKLPICLHASHGCEFWKQRQLCYVIEHFLNMWHFPLGVLWLWKQSPVASSHRICLPPVLHYTPEALRAPAVC